MNKLKQLKKAIKNTPPERLAKIEYQSHFMQIIGVSIVCGILIFKGYWWIIFAFIFSLGVSYSQGVSAYQKYLAIVSLIGRKKYNPKTDKSFTRKRDHYIKKHLGKYSWVFAALISVYVNIKFIPHNNWWQNIIFSFGFIFFYVVIYFFYFYWIIKFFIKEKK